MNTPAGGVSDSAYSSAFYTYFVKILHMAVRCTEVRQHWAWRPTHIVTAVFKGMNIVIVSDRPCWSVLRKYTKVYLKYQYLFFIRTTRNLMSTYTGCNRKKGPDFGRVFLRSNYTDITQNTNIQSSMVTEILAREVWNFDKYYSLIHYQIHIETGRNM